MKINHLFLKALPLLMLLPMSLSFVSCDNKKGNEPDAKTVDESKMKRVILVYAVNRSSLLFDFKNDSTEITKAMQGVDLSNFQVLVYKTAGLDRTALYKFAPTSKGTNEFTEIKSYPREETSTAPDKINTVINDALALYPNAVYDLILWGHGTAWRPEDDDHTLKGSTGGPQRAYGGEYNEGKTPSGNPDTDYVNVDELADAIPDHKFETIWFDCCYMSSVEVIYEFRNKCNKYVGYPTEVLSGGMDYDKVLPFLLKETPEVEKGAEAFFDAYNRKGDPVTVAVLRMDKLENLASAARKIVKAGMQYPSVGDQVNYSRMSALLLVDFLSYFTDIANANGDASLAADLKTAYENLVTYHAASTIDFRRREWDMSKVFCLSSAYYTNGYDQYGNYYKTLAWYNRLFH